MADAGLEEQLFGGPLEQIALQILRRHRFEHLNGRRILLAQRGVLGDFELQL